MFRDSRCNRNGLRGGGPGLSEMLLRQEAIVEER